MHCHFVAPAAGRRDRLSRRRFGFRRWSRRARKRPLACCLLPVSTVRRFALVAALFLPAAGFAQQISVTSSFAGSFGAGGAVTVNIGQSLCNSAQAIDFTYDLGTVPTSADIIDLWITKDSATCTSTTDPSPPNQRLTQPPQNQQTVTVTLHPVAGELLLSDLSGGCQNTTTTAAAPYTELFCVRRRTQGLLGSQTLVTGSLQVNFALVAPKAPSQPSISPGDSHLRIFWSSNDSGDKTYDVYVVPSGAAVDLTRFAGHNLSALNADLDHDSDGNRLVDGTSYDVYVRSVDVYGNASSLSTPNVGTPIEIDDFYSHYRNAGGAAAGGGGCSSGGSGGLIAAILVGATLWRRRAKAAMLAAALFIAAPASAADWTGLDRAPRRWLIALKLDRYDPQIDSEAGLTGTPYHDIFHGRAPPRYQLEVDYEALHPLGAILFGVTAGFWQNHGHGLVHGTTTTSEDTATLNIFPFGVIATYRFDWLADRYRWFPFIPYAQAGLQAAMWASLNGTGNVSSSSSGGRGSGWTYGYTTALGIAVDLSAIDLELAREAYVSTGIQRTSVFAEYGWTRLSNFGRSGALILSDRAWRFGVSVEF